MEIRIKQADSQDLDQVAPLFDRYRQYYHQPPDAELARDFIAQRMAASESVILLALVGQQAAGFIQFYPTFSSVSACRIWILNDLFVHPDQRKQGVARALMSAGEEWARSTGACGLVLETMPDNKPAQNLYEDLGWRRGETWHYELVLDPDKLG
jgi:GNAT superfamily N-acetyltransferase